jgi:hypothetical protein
MAAEAGGDLTIPQAERFDSNIITPVSGMQRRVGPAAAADLTTKFCSVGMTGQRSAQRLLSAAYSTLYYSSFAGCCGFCGIDKEP